MLKINCVTFLCLSLFVIASNAKVVSYIDPCKWNDGACILQSSKKALSNMGPIIEKGMFVKNINADNGDLKLKAKDVTVANLSKCTLVDVKRTEKLKLSIKLECPIDATGDYKIGGTMFHIPIDGDGTFSIKTDKLGINLDINMKKIKGKDGIEHYKFGTFDYKYTLINKVYFVLNNLFGGDAEKAAPFNKIFDEDWKEVISTFGGPVINAVCVQAVHVMNSVVTTIPVEEFEIPE